MNQDIDWTFIPSRFSVPRDVLAKTDILDSSIRQDFLNAQNNKRLTIALESYFKSDIDNKKRTKWCVIHLLSKKSYREYLSISINENVGRRLLEKWDQLLPRAGRKTKE